MLFQNSHGGSSGPVGDARDWLDRVGVLPLRFLVAAFLCPIIFSFAGQTKFVWPWDMIGDDGQGAGMFVLVPLLTMALLFGSRFAEKTRTRALMCIAAGFLSVVVMSFQSSWVLAALFLALVAVAAGNRVSKLFALQKEPAIVAAVGGAMVWGFALWPMQGSSAVGSLFSGQSWAGGGWMACFALVGVLVYAACGIGLALPMVDREKMQRTISVVSRGILVWMPACLIFGRMSLGPDMNMFDGGGITTVTLAFKVFAMSYAILITAAVGVAAFLTTWLWDHLDTPMPVADSDPTPPSMAPEPTQETTQETVESS